MKSAKKKIDQFDLITNQNVNLWLQNDYDFETKKTIERLIEENPEEVNDAFYKTLSFGTGGLRGLMGIGSNRINSYTVRAATQGLANYILKQSSSKKEGFSVFIGYDTRHNSRHFAEESAKVLAANGIRVYFCENIRPTPLVSFGVRYKKCNAAIVITASHNPSQYNGYKVYWNDGTQVLPPHDRGIIHEINLITSLKMINKVSTLNHPLIEFIGKEVDLAYLDAISSLQFYPQDNFKKGNLLKIVYTSLHGTGITLIPQLLTRWGFTQVEYVTDQITLDGDFPTVRSPNPEETSALKLGIETLTKTQSDILIATDPDADRVRIAVNHHGEIHLLNGNEIACICLEHICSALMAQGKTEKNRGFIKTIATTELFYDIVKNYHFHCCSVLPGFKYIGEKIRLWQQEQSYQFVFGSEESYGYLLGTKTGDKDGVLFSALFCEMALHAKLQSKTLLDLLHDLWQKYGIYGDIVQSIDFEESKTGNEQMGRVMATLRHHPPKGIGNLEVIAIEDYQTSLKTTVKTGKTVAIEQPQSNILVYWLKDKSKIIVRPSGTEPKIKLYCEVVVKKFKTMSEGKAQADQYANDLINAFKQKLIC